MKILTLADEECSALWDYYTPGMLKEYGLILSAGDLKADYLSFLVTMARCPLLYVHGNHDGRYDEFPPEGCDDVDDKLIVYKGIRILGLGGSRKYSGGKYQYTDREMKKRIRKLKRAIRLAGGVDIVLSHSAPEGVGDAEDLAHRGFPSFLDLIDTYHPKYVLHGHLHMNYATGLTRKGEYHGTQIINCCERFVLELEEPMADRPPMTVARRLALAFTKNLEYIDL